MASSIYYNSLLSEFKLCQWQLRFPSFTVNEIKLLARTGVDAIRFAGLVLKPETIIIVVAIAASSGWHQEGHLAIEAMSKQSSEQCVPFGPIRS